MNHNDYSKKILDGLEKKYNKTFEIEQLTFEVDGDSGRYYRAVCKEKNSNTSFVACYYLEDSSLTDEYCSLLLNEEIADYLVASDFGVSYAIIDADTVKHVLTMEDIEKGVEYCMSNEDFEIVVSAYLFVGCENINDLKNEDAITDKFLSFGSSRFYLEVIYIDHGFMSSIKEEYQEDIYMLDEKLEKDSRIVRHTCYSVSKEIGVKLTKVIKGE